MKKKNFTTDSGDNPLIISLSAFTNMSLSLQAKCQKESVVESFLYKVTLSPNRCVAVNNTASRDKKMLHH